MISSIKIENFRGISGLEIEQIPQISIITGMNGVGKTSLLEASMLLAGRYRAAFVLNIQGKRGYRYFRKQIGVDLGCFFSGFNSDGTCSISGNQNGDNVEIRINQKKNFSSGNIDSESLVQANPDTAQTEYPDTEFICIRNGKTEVKYSPIVIQKEGSLTFNIQGKEGGPDALIMAGHTEQPIEDGDIERFSRNISFLRDEEILKVLKNLNPDLEAIKIVSSPNRILVQLKGMDRLVPLEMLGAGVVNLFRIANGVAWVDDGWIGIDELGGGLHWSKQDAIFHSLFKYSKKLGTQLMMATHSHEALEAAVASAKKCKCSLAIIHLFRNEKGQVAVQVLDADTAASSLKLGYEIR